MKHYRILSQKHRYYVSWYLSMDAKQQSTVIGEWVLTNIVTINNILTNIERETERNNKRCMHGNYSSTIN